MALSGSTNGTQNAGQLIRAALLKLGVVNPTATVSDSTNQICLDALNRMIKAWQMQGVHLWTQYEGACLLDQNVASYAFSGASLTGGAVGMVRAEVLITTTLTADASAAATVLTLDDTTGMAATDKIVVSLTSGARHVTTIVSVDSATQVTITSGLAGAAADGLTVYAYPVAVNQTNLFYPKQITNVRLRYSATQERELTEYSRSDYLARSDKTLASNPFSYYIEDNLVNKKIYVFPVPNDLSQSLRFTFVKALDDVDALTNDIEFPVEWHKAIVLNLACEVAFEFGKDTKLDRLQPLANMALADALGWDDEATSVQLIPDLD